MIFVFWNLISEIWFLKSDFWNLDFWNLISLPKAMSICRSEILRKQEHKVSYRCSLPSPLQKRSKDSKELHCRFASFELLSFLWLWKEVSQKAEKLLAKVKENSEARVGESTFFAWFEPKHKQNLNAIFRYPWISSAMTMAMSIYRTLCVLV